MNTVRHHHRIKILKHSVDRIGWTPIVVFLAITAGLMMIDVSRNHRPNEARLVTRERGFSADADQRADSPTLKDIPDVVKSYAGTIVSVAEDSIVMQADADVNYLREDVRLTVLVTPATVMMRIRLPKNLRKGQQFASLTKRETISKDDLSVGDRVTVTALENAKGKIRFEAGNVEIRVLE